MMEMFNRIVEKSLTPNQFYLLYCMRENVASLNINMHLELRMLEQDGWINDKQDLQPKAQSLLAKVESFFKIQKKKTSSQLLGKDFVDNMTKYNELFPKIKGGSGKYIRSSIKNVETNFRWFFNEHAYSWETVLAATDKYIEEQERDNYKYIRTSKYFIRKQDASRMNNSDLADYCERIEQGDDTQEPKIFTEKVV